MHWRVLAVGKPKLDHAREGIRTYLDRLRGFAPMEMEAIKASDPEREGEALLARSPAAFRIVLDERGKLLTSRDFAGVVKDIAEGPHKSCVLIVGGADGLSDRVRSAADILWSLSPLTLQHEMALALALEQIYRAHTILAGTPYHRD